MRILNIATILFITLIALPLSICQAQNPPTELVDRIIAVVNDDVITLSDLNEEGNGIFQAIISKVPAQQQAAELNKARKEILGHLVDQLLLKQQADKIGIQIDKADIDQAVESILVNNNITIEKFRHDLQTMGTSEKAYRKKLKNQILKSRLLSFEIKSKIVVTDEEIKKYYEKSYKPEQANATGYHILQMGFLWGNKFRTKTREDAYKNAQYARQKLLAGANFAELAKALSDLPSAEDGGDIGQFKMSEMAEYMAKAIKKMHVGAVSEILQTPVGYQILKLKAAPGQEMPKLADVKDEIKDILYKQEGEKNYLDWLTKLRQKAYIKYTL